MTLEAPPDARGGLRTQLVAWSNADAIAAADATVTRLRELGVSVKPGNRLVAARDLISQADRFAVQYGHGSMETELAVAEANRTVFEQSLIVKRVQVHDEATRKRLEEMIAGPLVPTGRWDRPRDTQLELFAAVIFWGAGFRVDWGEPDLIASRPGFAYGIAVKRVSSDRQFRKRVREAQKQLIQHGRSGFIVVGAEPYLTRLYRAARSADLRAALFQKTGEWVDYLAVTKPDRVLGVTGLATSFRLARDGLRFWLEFQVHIHPRFVVHGRPEELAQVDAVGQDMIASLYRTITPLVQRPGAT